MDNKKWYYEFSVEHESKNSDGKIEKTEKKFAILKPNRRLKEEGELFFASETSRFAKAGVLPKAAWNTILSSGGGTLSEQDREEWGKLMIEYRDKSFDLQSILIKTGGKRSEEEQAYFDKLTEDLNEITKKMQAFESSQMDIFENTAEAKARNRTILWWVTVLAHKLVGEKFIPVFDAKTFEERLDQYDEIDESDDSNPLLLALRRITYLTTLWFLGRAETAEDFSALDKDFVKTLVANTSEIANTNKESTSESSETQSQDSASTDVPENNKSE